MNFDQLNLIPPILQAVKNKGYTEPTPIQEKAIPVILEGKDIFASAQTGTGKTAAFALPLIQIIHGKHVKNGGIKALILAPTRELAVQISDMFSVYGKNLRLFYTVVYGGVSYRPQTAAIRRGVDILVATPGRLLDLMNNGIVKLDKVEHLVLDEADRMLDMGFLPDIKRIIHNIRKERQTLFFSATTTNEIRNLARTILNNPETIDVDPERNTVDVKHQVFLIDKNDKRKLLSHIIEQAHITHALVFTRTKRGAEKLSSELRKAGVKADSIHGDKSQYARQRSLDDFKNGKVKILIATEVASRGIDIKQLPHVINYDFPETCDAYTHRIGRTGRAGASGIAISFCSREEKSYLRPVLRMYPGITFESHPFKAETDFKPDTDHSGGRNRGGQGYSGRRRNSGQGYSGRRNSGWKRYEERSSDHSSRRGGGGNDHPRRWGNRDNKDNPRRRSDSSYEQQVIKRTEMDNEQINKNNERVNRDSAGQRSGNDKSGQYTNNRKMRFFSKRRRKFRPRREGERV